MNSVSRYPRLNEPPFASRPILSVHGSAPLGELIWLAIPVIVFVGIFLFS